MSAQKNAVEFLVLELRTIKRLRELETIGTQRLAAGDKRGAAQAVAEYDQLVAMLNQLRAAAMVGMIKVETIEELVRHSYEVSLWCPTCKRWGPDMDLKSYLDAGKGKLRPADIGLKHRRCQTVLALTIKPPRFYGK